MEYKVKLYYNTGFNKENIPDGLNTLEMSTTYKEVLTNNFNLFQNTVIATLKIEKTFEEAMGIDYVVITPITDMDFINTDVMSFYTVENITMLSPLTAELELLIDPINSIGNSIQTGLIGITEPATNELFRNLIFVSGTLERGNTTLEEEEAATIGSSQFLNTPEPWAPENPLRAVGQVLIGPRTDNRVNPNEFVGEAVIPSYIDLRNVTATAKTYNDSVTGNSVTIPSLPLLTTQTEFYIRSSIGEALAKSSIKGLGLFRLSEPGIEDGIRNARALGLDNLILEPYVVPIPATPNSKSSNIISDTPPADGFYTNIQRPEQIIDINKKAYPISSAVDNIKTFELYRTINLLSITTGDSVTFSAEEIYAPGKEKFEFVLTIDYMPGGRAYLKPRNVYTMGTSLFEKTISSAQWTSPGMVIGTPAGSLNAMIANNIASMSNEVNNKIGMAQFELANMREDIKIATNAVNTAGGILSSAFKFDIGGIISAGAAGLESSVNAVNNKAANMIGMAALQRNSELAELSLKLEKAKVTMGGDIFSAPSNTIMNYTGPQFIYSEINISDLDALRFNNFLNLFGYNLSLPITDTSVRTRRLKSRIACNFIKTSNLKLKMFYPRYTISTSSPIKPQYLIKLAEMRFNSGVRIWHMSPNEYTNRNQAL